jgi:hypothetical protein
MKDKREGRFSLSKKESDYFKDGQDKIELVRCSLGGHNCSEHRAVINKNILASRKFLLNKDYVSSIEALKEAYNKTSDLQETSCINCANLFRCMVTQSLENIHEDLHKMATGMFFRKRYQSSYELAKIVLAEFKGEK